MSAAALKRLMTQSGGRKAKDRPCRYNFILPSAFRHICAESSGAPSGQRDSVKVRWRMAPRAKAAASQERHPRQSGTISILALLCS